MKFDFSCECGKGIRVLRGDLAQVTCGGCGKAVPVPAAIRSSRPSEFRSFADEAAPAAPSTGGGGDRIFFGICWAVGLAMFAVPFFTKSTTTELYKKAMADPTIENIRDFTEVESYGSRRDELIKAGWEKALAAKDVERLRTFFGNWGGEHFLDDKERRVWEFADRIGTEAAYELYLEHFRYEAHSQDAESALERMRGAVALAQEKVELSALLSSPNRAAALAFLDKYPESSSRKAACEIVLREIEAGWGYPENTPAPSLLRQIMDARASNEVTVSLSGFSADDTRQQVYGHLKARLEAIGLRVSEASSDGDIRVSGSESTDSRSFNKWGMADQGPFGETVSVTIEVYAPGSYDPAFTTSSYASTPSTVEYTYYDVDVGPSQGDVHRATLGVLSSAMESVFQYR